MSRLRTRAVAALSGTLLVAGLTAGCASGGGGSTAAAPAGTAHDAVAAAYTKTVDAGSARFQLSVTGSPVAQVTASGTIDFDHQRSELTLQLPNGMGTLQARYLDGTVYLEPPAALAALLGSGTRWISLDMEQLTEQKFGVTLQQLQSGLSQNPADLLGYLRGTGQHVRTLGPATVDGVATTHYSATIDLDTAASGQPASVRAAMQRMLAQLGTHQVPAELWIDAQGRVRKLLVTPTIAPQSTSSSAPPTAITEHVTVTFSDFGLPVTVSAPPADQTQDETARLSGGH